MAKRETTYIEPTRVKTIKGECQLIYELASIGMSKRSIAVRLGYSFADFQKLIEHETAAIQPFRLAYDAGEAEFEHVNSQTLIDILEDDNESAGIKAKIARDNLKAKSEEWAPQTRAVKIQVEDAANVFTFEAYSEAEQEAIKAQHPTDDPEETEA